MQLSRTLFFSVLLVSPSLFAGRSSGRSQSSNDGVITITSQEMYTNEITNNKNPHVIMFFKEGCPHCEGAARPYQAVAAKFKGRVPFYRISIKKFPEIARREGVDAVPKILYRKQGRTGNFDMGFDDTASFTQEVTKGAQQLLS